VANLAAGIELCQRLLGFGGLGHTCAIHSENDAAIRQFGQAVPAFRVCVNTSAVHGSIGYSTNLFPAMTLGCGAPGGNITSDNIGPQHLMNVKRIAWESRPVEHRSVPADQRMASTLRAEAAAAVAVAADAGSDSEVRSEAAPAAVPAVTAVPSAEPTKAPPHAPAVASGGFDRARIALLVEQVLSQYNIARGSGDTAATVAAPSSGSSLRAPQEAPLPPQAAKPAPSEIAAELAGRVFGSAAAAAAATAASGSSRAAALSTPATPAATPPPPPPLNAKISPFVSESDVRLALTRQEKIFIGPKTIVTPSALDLGVAHEVFVEIAGNTKA